jgi:chromosome segregation ATPase
MSKPTIKDLQEKLASLGARHAVLQGSNERMFKELKRLKGSPKVQEQLKAAHDRINELVNEVEKIKTEWGEVNYNLGAENERLKDDLVNANSDIQKLIKSLNDVTAENYALKAEIEITNRHINLAENALHEKEQPLVVNHYHNCTINK